MMYDFTADDVFEMAEQLERNGDQFYREAAKNTDNPEYKKLLVGLAEMEVQHEKTFVDLRSELSGNEKTLTAFDPQNESALYLRALADTKVFFEKEIDFSCIKVFSRPLFLLKKIPSFFIWVLKKWFLKSMERINLTRLSKKRWAT